MKDIAVGQRLLRCGVARPDQIVYVFHILQRHRQALDAVSDFSEHWRAVQSADLLEVGELGDFHTVQPDFPTQPPRAGVRGRWRAKKSPDAKSRRRLRHRTAAAARSRARPNTIAGLGSGVKRSTLRYSITIHPFAKRA